jgi:hypothetical protein
MPAMHMDAPCPNSGPLGNLTGGFASDAESLGGQLPAALPFLRRPAASIGSSPIITRVRAEQHATHCAERETAPRGNDDRFRNAAGSV